MQLLRLISVRDELNAGNSHFVELQADFLGLFRDGEW